jgi:hypothetical protein
MPELSKLLELKARYEALSPEARAAEDAEAWERMKQTHARVDTYVEQSLEGVPEQERWRFEHVPIHDLLRAKISYLTAHSQPRVDRRSTSRPRERRQRRTARTSGSRGDPSSSEPPLDRPLTAAERRYIKREVDRRRRAQLVAERDHLRAVPAEGWPA